MLLNAPLENNKLVVFIIYTYFVEGIIINNDLNRISYKFSKTPFQYRHFSCALVNNESHRH